MPFAITPEALQNLTPDQIGKRMEMSNLTFNAAKDIASMTPMIAIHLFLQRYLVTGVLMGAVKE